MKSPTTHIFSHEKLPFIQVIDTPEGDRINFILSELNDLGYQLVDKQWMLGGSQEINIYRFNRGLDELVLQEETYEGWKIFGKDSLMAEIQHLALM